MRILMPWPQKPQFNLDCLASALGVTMLFTSHASIAYGLESGRLHPLFITPNSHPSTSESVYEEYDSEEDVDDSSLLDFFFGLRPTKASTDSSSFSEQDTGCMPGALCRFGEARFGAALLLADPLPC